MGKKEQKNQNKKHPIITLFILLLLEAGLVFLFLPKDMVVRSTAYEQKAVGSYLGEMTAERIKESSDKWYRAAFVESGFLYATYNFFGQYDKDDGLNFDDRGLGRLIDKRLDVFWLATYLATYRFSLLIVWLPYLFPIILAASVDGLLQREIRKWQFSFSSPMAHQSAARVIYGAVALAILAPFLPVPTPPLAAPVLLGVIAVALWVNFANIQKRI